jgi:hypothetical protein
LASKGFLPLYEYIKLKSNTKKSPDADAPTPEGPESENIRVIDALRDESEEASDEASPVQGPCAHSSVNSASEVESESDECVPVHNARLRLRHLARLDALESEESTGDDDDEGNDDDEGDDDGEGVSNYRGQCVSEETTKTVDDKEIHTGREYLEDL